MRPWLRRRCRQCLCVICPGRLTLRLADFGRIYRPWIEDWLHFRRHSLRFHPRVRCSSLEEREEKPSLTLAPSSVSPFSSLSLPRSLLSLAEDTLAPSTSSSRADAVRIAADGRAGRENVTVQSAAGAAGGMSGLFVAAVPAMYQLNLLTTPEQDIGPLIALSFMTA